MFHVEAERAPYAALVKLLTKEDVLLSELACRVLVRLLAARPEKDAAEPPRTDAAGASSSQPEPALSGEVRPPCPAHLLRSPLRWWFTDLTRLESTELLGVKAPHSSSNVVNSRFPCVAAVLVCAIL